MTGLPEYSGYVPPKKSKQEDKDIDEMLHLMIRTQGTIFERLPMFGLATEKTPEPERPVPGLNLPDFDPAAYVRRQATLIETSDEAR